MKLHSTHVTDGRHWIPPRKTDVSHNTRHFKEINQPDASVLQQARPRLTALLPPRSKVKPEAVNAVVSSWWWAWRRPKHVERNKTSGNKLVKLLHLVG